MILSGTSDGSLVLAVGLQSKLIERMDRRDAVVVSAKLLLRVANLLGRRIILGELAQGQPGELLPAATAYADATFPIAGFNAAQSESFWKLLPPGASEVLLLGAEAHSSVLQTGLSLLKAGKSVWIVADAVAAHDDFEKRTALGRLAKAGADIVSVEMVIYEWLSVCGERELARILPLLQHFSHPAALGRDQLGTDLFPDTTPVAHLDSIGKKLRRSRVTRGLTQKQVAQRCRCCPSQLSKIENDKALPSLALLNLLSKVLESDIRSFVAGIDQQDTA